MKAAVCTAYGPPEVVQIQEVPTPAPGDGEVLVKAAATTVNSGDARLRAMNVPRGMAVPARLRMGLTKLRQPILGFEMAGRVEAVGAGVSGLQPGERVVASRGFDFGCHAEFAVVSAQGAIVKVPEPLSDQDAVALCFGGSTALYFFQRGKLAAGETVLINGASGAVGTMAVQLAKHSAPRSPPSAAPPTPTSSAASGPTTWSTTPPRTSRATASATTSSWTPTATRPTSASRTH